MRLTELPLSAVRAVDADLEFADVVAVDDAAGEVRFPSISTTDRLQVALGALRGAALCPPAPPSAILPRSRRHHTTVACLPGLHLSASRVGGTTGNVGILASLLPGVRHLRAPLAAGYLWFTVGWIFLHDHVRRASGDGALAAFTALRDELSVAVVGVAVSFAAFIAGALTQPVGMAVPLSLTRMYRVLRDGSTRTIYLPTGYAERHGPLPAELSLRRAKLLLEMEVRFVEDLSGKHVFDVGDWLYKRELRGSTPADAIVRDDLPLIHRRLAGEQKTTELFAEIDRTQSEAELRLAVWLPLAVALVAFAATQWDGVRAWLAVPVAAGVAVGLAVQGVRRLRAANDTLVDNVRLDAGGSANFPTFQHLAVSAQREEERIKREEVADKERRERVAQVDAEQKEASRQRLRDIEADLKEVEGQLEQ